jgi:hypothetical protein
MGLRTTSAGAGRSVPADDERHLRHPDPRALPTRRGESMCDSDKINVTILPTGIMHADLTWLLISPVADTGQWDENRADRGSPPGPAASPSTVRSRTNWNRQRLSGSCSTSLTPRRAPPRRSNVCVRAGSPMSSDAVTTAEELANQLALYAGDIHVVLRQHDVHAEELLPHNILDVRAVLDPDGERTSHSSCNAAVPASGLDPSHPHAGGRSRRTEAEHVPVPPSGARSCAGEAVRAVRTWPGRTARRRAAATRSGPAIRVHAHAGLPSAGQRLPRVGWRRRPRGPRR